MDMSRPKALAKWIYGLLPFKKQVFCVVRGSVRLPERVYRHLHFKGIFTVPVGPKKQFRIRHHGYVIENELFWRGLQGWEKVSLELWTRLCKRSDVILDIGANTGMYSLLAKAVNPGATVVAAEPVLRVHEKLVDNISLNGNTVHAVRAAISDRTGVAILYDLPENDHVLSVSLDPDWNKESSSLTPIEVPCMTVLDLLRSVGRTKVDLLKIDVETHEPSVLKGFIDLLRADRPTLLIEILTDEVASQVSELVDGLDYLYFNIDDINWPPKRTDQLCRSEHFNFLICQADVARSIGL